MGIEKDIFFLRMVFILSFLFYCKVVVVGRVCLSGIDSCMVLYCWVRFSDWFLKWKWLKLSKGMLDCRMVLVCKLSLRVFLRLSWFLNFLCGSVLVLSYVMCVMIRSECM